MNIKKSIWKIGHRLTLWGMWIKRASGHNPTRRKKSARRGAQVDPLPGFFGPDGEPVLRPGGGDE